ncbi:MAG: peptidylprolyl isomerase, partial [Planctomycetaceae bacterium]|nr:peptidylprolyl isomerase [Planctomycetaceae bacterium]
DAEKWRGEALQKPELFGELAMEHSCDASSAAAKGLIQPIRKHLGIAEIEQAAFALEDGQISEIIAVGDQFVFLKCEGRFPARDVPLASVEKLLRDSIRDRKLRTAADDVFRQLQDSAQLDIVYNDPQRREQEPGIAARINGHTITLADLAEECIARHGREVLEGVINRRLLEQECRRKNITIGQADIDRELARAAESLGKVDPQTKKPDVAAWLQAVTLEQGVPADVYIQDAVWPSVALKRLVEKSVEISQQDLDRGFEANYGPRVRCRAIVLNNMRRANEVWEMARRDPSVANFSRLAEQFSIEASSRALAGEVPPIQKWGGSPVLEKEAFALAPGELSGVIQVGEQYVILLCEGHTKPVAANFDEVKDLLREDIFEKKLNLAMANEFDRLKQAAQIDNFLANTSHKPAAATRESVSLDAGVQPATANQPRMGTKVATPAAPAGQVRPTKAPVKLSPAPVNRPLGK